MRSIVVMLCQDGTWTARYQDAMLSLRGATADEALDAFCAYLSLDRSTLRAAGGGLHPMPHFRWELDDEPARRAG